MFSTTSEYALRAMVCLAQVPFGTSILGQDLAERAEIPPNYLAKILWALRNAGLLNATRGLGGGYRLAKLADQIKLIEIVRQFQGVQAEPGCLLGLKQGCSDDHPCSAHAAFKQLKESYLTFIRTTTLAEIGMPQTQEVRQIKTRVRRVRQPST